MTHAPFPLSALADTLTALKTRAPLVHCLTNEVVQDITANVLLAAGASPAMVVGTAEAAVFAGVADALLINVGTLTEERATVMKSAINAANAAKKSWVLDPVAVGGLTYRTDFCRDLLSCRPTAIRANASEILALAGKGGAGRGVESGNATEEALESAIALARQIRGVVAVTGITDYVTDGDTTWSLSWGDAMMTRVTGVGCALSALVAAFLALPDGRAVDNVAAALALMGVAGEKAAKKTREEKAGVGTFRVLLLDMLDVYASQNRDLAREA